MEEVDSEVVDSAMEEVDSEVVDSVMEEVDFAMEAVDCKRMYMQLDKLFLRQCNILHQNSYCCNSVHVLDFDSNSPHYPASINSDMY